MTPIEAAAAFVLLFLVFLCGTFGTHIGTVVMLVAAWTHDPLMLVVGALWNWACMPDGSGKGGSGGRTKHA